jgi:hypothetical protein
MGKKSAWLSYRARPALSAATTMSRSTSALSGHEKSEEPHASAFTLAAANPNEAPTAASLGSIDLGGACALAAAGHVTPLRAA